MSTLYRCIAKEYFSDEIIKTPCIRLPSNIPYFVDNIWELFRPGAMPSRRQSAYASPKKSLALKYANSSELLTTVEFPGSHSAAQITDYPDARLHPDVKALPLAFKNHVGEAWLTHGIKEKAKIGQLFMPTLSQQELTEILQEHPSLKQALRKACTFWEDCEKITPETELTDGEVFFTAPSGYLLKKA